VVPLFVFMGLLSARGEISKNLYEGLSIWLGRAKAGLGIATVGACTAFGTICGSALVTAAVFGEVSAPEMRRHGYSKELAYGICASAGTIGMLIPPSVFIVIYAILTEESVGKLLVAGIAPGLTLAVVFSLGIWAMSRLRPSIVGATTPTTTVSWRQRIASLRLFWPIVLIAVIIIGGIFGGVFSPTEAGAVAALAVLIIVLVTGGKERWKQVREGVIETVSTTAMIFLILGGAVIFSRFLTLTGITTWVMESVIGLNLSPLALVALLAGVLLIMGCFLDGTSIMCITIPVIYPTIRAMGIEPMWFGMVAILAIHVGLITPPVGINVYAVKGVAEADVSLEEIFRGVLPFFIMSLVALAFIILVPWASTIFPSLMMEG